MKRKILMLMLWGFPFCFCGGAEFPEFTVEDYGSELVGLDANDLQHYVNTWGQFKKQFPINGDWAQYVNDWDYVLEWIRENGGDEADDYIDNAIEYFEQNPTAPNNPFYKPEPEDPAMPLIDDIGAIMGMILMGIAYGIFAYRVRRQ